MPVLGTRGAASAKAFGWSKQSGSASYRYVSLISTNTNSVYGGTTVAGMTALPSPPPSGTIRDMVGVVADGSFIAIVGGYYSLNNGSSWTSWGGGSASVKLPPGLNGAVAYSSNGGKYAAQIYVLYDYKAGQYFCSSNMISRTGTTAGAGSFNIGYSTTVRTIMYSPTLNAFYITGWGSSEANVRCIDGSSPASGATTTSVTTSGWRFGVSHNGYPIAPVYLGGSSWSLREYTAFDLSSYTSLGGLSFTPSKASPWTWLPVNNKYIVGGAGNTGGTISIYTSTSGSPGSLTNVGSASVATYAVTNINFMEETTGRIWMSGWAQNQDPKSGVYDILYTQYSDDAGVSWSAYSLRLGASKNFT